MYNTLNLTPIIVHVMDFCLQMEAPQLCSLRVTLLLILNNSHVQYNIDLHYFSQILKIYSTNLAKAKI